MTHTYHHAQNSARLFGGEPEEFMELHCWMDETKEHMADFRHRALRHHSQGVFEGERVFGNTITLSTGKKIPVRYVLEQHILEDCAGKIPTIADWLSCIRPESWMARGTPVHMRHGTRRTEQ